MAAPDIPLFHLYGEGGAAPAADPQPEFVHIEDIQARSRALGWEIGPHVHRGMVQFLFIQDGEATAVLDDCRLRARGPCVVVVPPTAVHGFTFHPETRGWVLTIAESLAAATAERAGTSLPGSGPQPALVDLAGSMPASLLGLLAEEFAAQRPGRVHMLDCLVSAVALVVWRRVGEMEPRPVRDRVRAQSLARFRALVEENYRDHWPVPRYAAALGTTPARLNRLVRAGTGASAFDLIGERLVLEAKRKLIHVATPVTALAYDLGFQDPAYFCRFFKRRTGVSPQEFRRRATG